MFLSSGCLHDWLTTLNVLPPTGCAKGGHGTVQILWRTSRTEGQFLADTSGPSEQLKIMLKSLQSSCICHSFRAWSSFWRQAYVHGVWCRWGGQCACWESVELMWTLLTAILCWKSVCTCVCMREYMWICVLCRINRHSCVLDSVCRYTLQQINSWSG